jgi:hypothetical protein
MARTVPLAFRPAKTRIADSDEAATREAAERA